MKVATGDPQRGRERAKEKKKEIKNIALIQLLNQ